MPLPPAFGRLRRIELRRGWSHEALDFTPRLAEPGNIAPVSEAISIPPEVPSVERSVGPFRAGIACRCPTDASLFLLKNRIARTDHGHLGRVPTDAAGLDAATILWTAAPWTG